MIKRFITVLIAISMLCGLTAYAEETAETEATATAYNTEYWFKDGVEYIKGSASDKLEWPGVDEAEGTVGNTMLNNIINFGEIDFGTFGPESITVKIGLAGDYPDRKLYVYIDDYENSEPVAEVTLQPTGGWTTYVDYTAKISSSVPISGIHTLYFKCGTSPVGNLKTFSFTENKFLVTEPSVTLYSRLGRVVTAIGSARTANVSGKTIFGESDAPFGVAMVGVSLDSDNTILKSSYDYKEDVTNTETDFFMEKMETGTSPTAFFAYYQNDSGVVYNNTKKIRTAAELEAQYTSESKAEVFVDGRRVEVSGTGVKGDITLVVTPSDKADKYWENMYAFYQTTSDGSPYSIVVNMPVSAPGGTYTAHIYDGDEETNINFEYTAAEEMLAVLTALKAATSENIGELLEANAAVFGIDKALYTSLTEKDELNVTLQSEITAAIPEDLTVESELYSYIEAIREIYNKNIFWYVLNYSASAEVLTDYIAENSEALGISDNNLYKVYFLGENTDAIIKKYMEIEKGEMTSNDDFESAMKQAVILSELESAISWGVIDELIVNFKSDIGLNLKSYEAHPNTKKEKVCSEFFDEIFNSYDDVIEVFDEAYNKYMTGGSSGGGSSSGGGGGSGGGSSSSSSSARPTVTVKEPEPVVEKEITYSSDTLLKSEDGTAESGSNSSSVFADLSGYSWAVAAISSLKSNGYISGKADGIFAPADSITREEFVKIVVGAFEIKEENAVSAFYDIPETHWANSYVSQAVAAGIIKGVSETQFGSGQNITREDMAVILHRVIKYKNRIMNIGGTKPAFVDSDFISDYAEEAVSLLTRAGVISGKGNDVFDPKGNATRAEAAVMIYRVLYN